MSIAPKTRSILLASIFAAACGRGDAMEADVRPNDAGPADASTTPAVAVRDTLMPVTLVADGIARPLREATLSTKLMATVTEVLVHEGDRVAAGQLLVRLDARDLEAKAEQASAGLAAAEAQRAQAATQAARLRALYADAAAPRAMLDAAETQLAQADAGERAARAAHAELAAIGSYAEVRAPFAGRVARRSVDPGDFAAPGAPLVTVEDDAELRITAHVVPEAARTLRRGAVVAASLEDAPATARIEGITPAPGSLYAVNAIVPNPARAFLAGSAASLRLPAGSRRMTVIPADALLREGDLTGVVVRTARGEARRWIRVGERQGALLEVTSGLDAGELVVRRSAGGSR